MAAEVALSSLIAFLESCLYQYIRFFIQQFIERSFSLLQTNSWFFPLITS